MKVAHFKLHLLEVCSGCMGSKSFSQGEDPLDRSRAGALDHHKVVLHDTISAMKKVSHECHAATSIAKTYRTKPPRGVTPFFDTSNSVAPLASSAPFAIR